MKIFQYNVLPIEEQRSYFPKWLGNGALAVYFSLLLLISAVFLNYAMEWYFMLIGIIEVVGFFYYANYLTKKWGIWKSEKRFETHVFWMAFAIRSLWVVFSYVFYWGMTGTPFEYSAADSLYYNQMAGVVADNIWEGNFDFYTIISEYSGSNAISDMGFPILLGILYAIIGKSILLSRIVRSFVGAYTCLLIYRLAKRTLGMRVARIAAVLCMLCPLLYHYNAMQLKETEMTCLVMFFAERSDDMLRDRKIALRKLLLVVVIGLSLFLFRTVIGMVAFLALLFAVVFSSDRIVSWGKKIIMAVLLLSVLGVSVSDRVLSEINEIRDTDVMAQQQISMQYRYGGKASRGKNELAKYAGAAVFAPLVFTLPFPTMVVTPRQEDMRLIHSGNFIKNVLSCFVIFAMIILLLSGEWRKAAMPIALLLGYLVVLVFSQFAHSVRFHIPIIPLELMFAAYGLCQLRPQHRKWVNLWLVFVFVANIGWAWFKLKGRGAI